MMRSFSLSSFVAGFMLGMLFVGAWLFNNDPSLVPLLPAHSLSHGSGASATSPESGAISVNDQTAGSRVIIDSVTVPPPGVWVAVRETNGNDLGNVLGAARVTGPQSQVTVSLLRVTDPGQTYAVELYRDDSSDTFNLATDSVYVDFTTGAPVVAYFTTTD